MSAITDSEGNYGAVKAVGQGKVQRMNGKHTQERTQCEVRQSATGGKTATGNTSS